MELKERIESRVSFQRIRLGRGYSFSSSVFIDGKVYVAIKKTKELCIQALIRKVEIGDGESA